ncbi:MAG: hypothetical protein ACO3LZ_05775, partial [Candidatus Nanopelagicales bacterium]
MPETWGPLLIAVVGFAALLYGFSKTAMPVAAVAAGPLLAAALGPTVAAGFAVPLLILGDLIGLLYFRQHADWRLIAKIAPGVLVGFLITAALFAFASTSVIARVIGVLLLVSVGLEVLRRRSARLQGSGVGGAGVAVAAADGGVHAARAGVAAVGGADALVVAARGGAAERARVARARPGAAGVTLGAGVAVVAGGAV